tara:strand:- start:2122 stop:2292 length:171 start_codon:yes stop_codon:yes gene_type:complete
MRHKSKTNYVANGIMTFIGAIIYEHKADELAVYRRVVRLAQAQADRLEGLDVQRNK